MTITGVNASLNAGQTTTLSFNVKNNNGGVLGGETSFNIAVNTTINELQCQGNCDFTDTIDLGATKSYSVTLRAGNVAAGQSRSGAVRITAEVGNDDATASRNIRVQGPEAPPEVQTVAEVSGRVTDETSGDGVSGASVRLTDGQGRTHTTNTSGSGNYRFTGSQDRPIAPGRLQIRATKDGITDTKEVNGGAGARVNNQGIQLALAGAPTPSTDATVGPTEDAAEEVPTEDAGAEESADAAPDQTANEDDGGGLGSWVLILAGGLLVALGVGAIVLLLMRRKEDGEDDVDGVAGAGGPGPRTGAGRGGYRDDDATRVTNRAGADPTMVAAGGGNLADAPTMMHSAPLVDDEFPDPYGAPLPGPQGPGYGGGQQGWGDNANGYGEAPGSGAGAYGNAPGSGAGGYGNAPASGVGYGNAPGSGAGYGAPVSGGGYSANGAGGYDNGYDEPTGRYTGDRDDADGYGPAADPYDTNAYRPSSGAGHGGYEPTQQYGRDDDGYDTGAAGYGRGGYDDEPRTGAGYDQQGYDSRGGYDQQGYEADRAGYDQPTTGAGYDQQRGGYDDHNGYDDRAGYGQQQGGGGYYDDDPRAGGHSRSGAPQQPGRSERRSLDWLDD
ncbi:carboxypeptidase-like regulatory domain-containing protein [Micromonospora sp. WMMD1102]|uniref:carboxypeptidase-like regulatory domain-containing protein n=1 Tax=Micromonospora sp. WMMD1102 TaxID=3016105 RepID=UPI0024156BCB|nr:carboxypeptidase-like regulatory domain-containing protein [Micromonospora sp. WMMD1102]MDG4790721.1 carboxypeptidase-like regulatory domain-containing protein [Micromonospora sp. WMMD1102]